MRLLPVASALLVVAASLATAAPPSASGVPIPGPKSAAGRLLAVDTTLRRVGEVVAQAQKDRQEVMVDVYRRYTDDELRDPKRGVTLDMLLVVVNTDNVAKEVRQRAAESIYMDRVITNDPTLDMNGRREKRARAVFSIKVLKLLTDNDEFVRALASNILTGLWPGWGNRKKEIKACKPQDRSSCVEAAKAWNDVFRSG